MYLYRDEFNPEFYDDFIRAIDQVNEVLLGDDDLETSNEPEEDSLDPNPVPW